MLPTTNDLFDDDAPDARLEATVQIVRDEAEAILALMPDASARQWSASQAMKPREDTTERSSGAYSDPTSDAALDERRLDLRASVDEAEGILRDTAARARAVRLGLERAITRWNGSKE